MARRVVSYEGLRVRLKKGQTALSAQQKGKISNMRGNVRSGAGCVIFFAGGKAVQRCDTPGGLKKSARRTWTRRKKNKEICFKKKGKLKLFARCR